MGGDSGRAGDLPLVPRLRVRGLHRDGRRQEGRRGRRHEQRHRHLGLLQVRVVPSHCVYRDAASGRRCGRPGTT